jgi:hypothetical protein
VKAIGHVSSQWHGRDLLLRCNNCGQTECIADYAGGGKPRLFGWAEPTRSQPGFAKCHCCLMVYDRSADRATDLRDTGGQAFR